MADRLTYMKDYHIDRDVMCDIVNKTIGYELLMDCFCYGQFSDSDEFSWFRSDDEFYIIHKNSGMMINWYKHLGRTNTCSQKDRTVEDYYEFFNKFKEDLKYWYEEHKYEMPGIKVEEKPEKMSVLIKAKHLNKVMSYIMKHNFEYCYERSSNIFASDDCKIKVFVTMTKSDAVIFQNFLKRLQEGK